MCSGDDREVDELLKDQRRSSRSRRRGGREESTLKEPEVLLLSHRASSAESLANTDDSSLRPSTLFGPTQVYSQSSVVHTWDF